MPAPKLVLYPDVSLPPPVPAAILAVLRDFGVIGGPFELDGRTHYRTGPGFLNHLSFLGCSPAIELDPPATGLIEAARSGRFCHVQLHPLTHAPRVRHRAGQGPRCRACRSDLMLDALTSAEDHFACPGCGRIAAAAGVNWRQAGGCARLFLDIWGIHTGEAVPGEQLLAGLGEAWRFFYLED